MQWNDSVRAAFMSLAQSVFPMLELAGIIHLTSDQVAICMLFIQNVVTFGMLVFKKGQAPGDPITAAKGSEQAPATVAGVATLTGGEFNDDDVDGRG